MKKKRTEADKKKGGNKKMKVKEDTKALSFTVKTEGSERGTERKSGRKTEKEKFF